jgi:hypothetical protein
VHGNGEQRLEPLTDSSSSRSDDDLTPIRSSAVSLMESVMAMTEPKTTSERTHLSPGLTVTCRQDKEDNV